MIRTSGLLCQRSGPSNIIAAWRTLVSQPNTHLKF